MTRSAPGSAAASPARRSTPPTCPTAAPESMPVARSAARPRCRHSRQHDVEGGAVLAGETLAQRVGQCRPPSPTGRGWRQSALSQNTIRTSLAGVRNGANPSLNSFRHCQIARDRDGTAAAGARSRPAARVANRPTAAAAPGAFFAWAKGVRLSQPRPAIAGGRGGRGGPGGIARGRPRPASDYRLLTIPG
jgi:hypothetical protein